MNHRAEFSETCGFRIVGKKESIIYLPDIDNLQDQKTDFMKIFKENTRIFLDGTFFDENELSGVRNLKEIPHPFIKESVAYFNFYDEEEKKKLFFIHLNHTNPCLKDNEIRKKVLDKGYNFAKQFDSFTI